MSTIGFPELFSLGGLLCIGLFVALLVIIILLVRRNRQPPSPPPT